jgi:hypothetical protein
MDSGASNINMIIIKATNIAKMMQITYSEGDILQFGRGVLYTGNFCFLNFESKKLRGVLYSGGCYIPENTVAPWRKTIRA